MIFYRLWATCPRDISDQPDNRDLQQNSMFCRNVGNTKVSVCCSLCGRMKCGYMGVPKLKWYIIINYKRLICTTERMPKNKKLICKKDQTDKSEGSHGGILKNEVVYLGKNGEVIIKVLAKPRAKESTVTGISEDGVGIQIAAPPTDGEANKELIKFLAETLDLHKSDFNLEKGSKSREKTVVVNPNVSSVDFIFNKLKFVSKN